MVCSSRMPVKEKSSSSNLPVTEAVRMNSPGVKEGTVQQGAIVVVPHIVSLLTLARAHLRYHLGLHHDAILRVMKVQENNIEDQ